MTQRTALTLVTPDAAKPVTAAARLRANQEAQKTEAKTALLDLLARATEIAAEAKDLATLDVYTPKQREFLTALGINTNGSIEALTPR